MKRSSKKRKFSREDRNGNPASGQILLMKDVPFAFTEAYKILRTNLNFVASATEARCILITSAVPNESKSTTAVNLAITLAGSGHSVIVVECDMRKPVLRKYLKLERGSQGLSALLCGIATVEDCTNIPENLGISVIHAGAVPPNPAELLGQERMNDLIRTLKQRYDYVILDAPPVTVVTDAAVVGRVADGALLVVRSKFAPAKTVRLAKRQLESVGVKLLGAVITRFDVKKSGWGYGYGSYDYGYGAAPGRSRK